MASKAKRALTGALIALTLAVTMTGCWDNQPLNTRTLVLAMGFYPGPKPGTVQVDFAYPTPSGLASSNPTSGSGGSSSTPSFGTLTGIGSTLAEAFSAAQAKTSHDLYLGHTVLLVFSTQLKPTELKRLTDALNRIGTLDKTPFVAASPAPFDKVVGVKMPQEEFPSLYYEQLFSCTTCSQLTLGLRLWQMMERLVTPGVDLVLPVLTPTPEGPAVDRVAIYHKFQYATTLTPKQTTAYGIAAGLSKKTGVYLPRYWQADFNAVSDTSTVSARTQGGSVDATVALKVTATLQSLSTGTESAHQLSVLSKQLSKILAGEVLQFLDTTQKNDTDVLGVGRSLSWSNPQTFSAIPSWHAEYPKVHFTVKCMVTINKMGDIK